MLKNNLYFIKKIATTSSSIDAHVELSVQHAIFEGHFPGHPVLPGACMLQMVKELLETFFEKPLQLAKADDVRFSAMVDPTVNKELTFAIQYHITEMQSLNVNAKILKQDNTVCCKIKASFKADKNVISGVV
jgi:3-hydroxyacyl-[acyl-carrier-protein] dehydratase